MSNEEKSPVKHPLRRDTRGIMNYLLESPNGSDVVWAKDTPVKSSQFNTMSTKTKSTNDHQQATTPRPNIKRFLSSPLLISQSPTHSSVKLAKKAQVEQRLCEELAKQFGDITEYKPRSLLNKLTEELDEQIQNDKLESKSKSLGDLNTADNDLDPYNELDDIELLTQLEEEAKKIMEMKMAKEGSINNKESTSAIPNLPSIAEIESKIPNKKKTQPPVSQKKKDNLTQSDEDDDIMLSIPMECLIDPNYNSSSNQETANAKSKFKFIEKKPVIATKRFSDDKISISHAGTQQNSNSGDQPITKKRCTAEEIEEKRQQALKRREQFLKSKRTQINK